MTEFKTIHECRLELIANTVERLNRVDGTYDVDEADWLPVSAARASFGKEDKTGEDPEKDLKLLKFLANNRHVSVFEHNYATFLVECPLFVRSQIMRHKSFSFNEVSRRYTSEDISFWIPDKFRKQSKSNKQASTDEEVTDYVNVNAVESFATGEHPKHSYIKHHMFCEQHYISLLASGVSREQARAVLPQSLLTRFYMSGNLRSWWSFLSSRLKEDTQYETRVVAEKIEKELRNLWPESVKALLGD